MNDPTTLHRQYIVPPDRSLHSLTVAGIAPDPAGAGALEVDAPEEHLQALLDRRAARLSAVAKSPNAPQMHPEDYRCVPTGNVGLGDRTLEGVVLTLDLQCRVQVVEDDTARRASGASPPSA